MSEFKRLSLRDAETWLRAPGALEETPCPACGNPKATPAFTLHAFTYRQCAHCASLYVSPRPSQAALARYYAESEASHYRVEHFSRDTAKARRYHLLVSHANWMGQLVDESGAGASPVYVDIETYAPEIFEEIARLGMFARRYAVRPLLHAHDAVTVQDWALPEPAGAVSAFEKMEHQHNPLRLLQQMTALAAPDGMLFFTTRTCTGFDLQVLRENAPYIFVPEHLNLLSIEGIHALLDRAGLELVELSTPGQLDLQLVQQAREANPALVVPPFVSYLLDHRDALAHEDFQAFLQKHRLSSHVRAAARKKRSTT